MNPDASIASVLNPGGIPTAWLVLGFFGQVMFSFRFLLQWIASERRRISVIPGLFWWFSIAGGTCLLVYAVLRRDTVMRLKKVIGCLCILVSARFIRAPTTQSITAIINNQGAQTQFVEEP